MSWMPDWSASAKRYTGGKILVANLPGVDIGSTIEVEFEITMKNMPFIGGFEPFQLPDDLQKILSAHRSGRSQDQRWSPAAAPFTAQATSRSRMAADLRTGPRKNIAAPARGRPTCRPIGFTSPASLTSRATYNAYLKDLNDTLLDRSQSRAKAAALREAARRARQEQARRRQGHPRFRRQVHPPRRALLHRTAPERTLESRHHAHRRLRPCRRPRHPAPCHAFRGGISSRSSSSPRTCRPWRASSKIATSFPLPDSFDTPLVKVTVDGETYYLNDTDQYAQPRLDRA